jgi:glutamine cyclotransferase
MDGTVVEEIEIGENRENACGIHIEGRYYLIGYRNIGKIEQRSLGNHQLINEFNALDRIVGITRIDNTLWYTDYEKGLLVGMDLVSKDEIGRYKLNGGPTGLAWDGTIFWYSDFENRCIRGVRIDYFG